MKFWDLKVGEECSGRFRVLGQAPSKKWVDTMVEIRASGLSAVSLRRYDGEASVAEEREVRPESRDAERLLDLMRGDGLAVIASVTEVDGPHVDVVGRAFAEPPRAMPSELVVGLTGEFIDNQLRWRRVNDFESAVPRLRDEFLLDGQPYWFVTFGRNDADYRKGLSLVGRSRMLDLSLEREGMHHALRLPPLRNRSRDARAIYLIRGDLVFQDAEHGAALNAETTVALEQAVSSSTSWVRRWEAYNNAERQLFEERFGRLPDLHYRGRSYRHGADSEASRLSFDLEAHADLSPWKRYIGADGLAVEIVDGREEAGGSAKTLSGSLIECDSRTRRLVVEWEQDSLPPARGIIRPSLTPEKARLARRARAIEALETMRAKLPSLGLIVEGSPVHKAVARRRRPLPKAARKIFGGPPTPAQEHALDVALATPDVALILGPPGTGKTRVIQAILAALNDGREPGDINDSVLVTSFQHEAVDNAVAGMSVTGLPVDRRGGRRGEDRGAEVMREWIRGKAAAVRAQLPEHPGPNTVLLDRLRKLLSHWRRSPLGERGTIETLRDFRSEAAAFMTPERLSDLDRLLTRPPSAEPQRDSLVSDPVDIEEIERALGELRSTRDDFAEDGARQARGLRRELRPYANDIPAELLDALDAAASWEEGSDTEPWTGVQDLVADLRTVLFEPTRPEGISEIAEFERAAETCLTGVIADVAMARDASLDGVEEALRLYVRSLEEDPEHVRDALQKYAQVQAVTCGQADSRQLGLSERVFSVVIADEAARANPLDLLIPMVKGRRIILVGDHKQLPHVLEPEIEQSLEKSDGDGVSRIYKESLFERLWSHLPTLTALDGIERCAQLTDQFRMHPVIGEFVSKQFYDADGRRLSSALVDRAKRPNLTGEYDGKPVAWVDVPAARGMEERVHGSSWSRRAEVETIAAELRRILPRILEAQQQGYLTRAEPVGVIAFYSAQEELLLKALDDRSDGLPENLRKLVRVGTVDAFQGREYDVVYLSTVRSNEEQSVRRRLGFTALPNRLCVAFSRARCVLVSVGDSACVGGTREDGSPWSPELKAYIDLCRSDEGSYVVR
jgi:hypothetical protein